MMLFDMIYCAATTFLDFVLQEGPQHKRRSFDKEDATELLNLCENLIQGKVFNQGCIISHLQSSDEGLVLLNRLKDKLGPMFRKKIYDRLRCAVRKQGRVKY